MNRLPQIAACLLLPMAGLAANRTYPVAAFDAVSVAAGVDVEISLGAAHSVTAETRSSDFDDLRISVQGNVLKIDRPPRGWFQFRRPDYRVRVVTPALHSVVASSGSDVDVKGTSDGAFSVEASSGSDVGIVVGKAGTVKVAASSGSDVEISGTCTTLEARASSGSDVEAGDLRCETATVQASSGSDVSVFASRSVSGAASSGSDVQVSGSPANVNVERSSGADVRIRK